MVLNINYVQSSILEIASDLGFFFFNQWQLNKDIKGNFIEEIAQVETGLRTNPILIHATYFYLPIRCLKWNTLEENYESLHLQLRIVRKSFIQLFKHCTVVGYSKVQIISNCSTTIDI